MALVLETSEFSGGYVLGFRVDKLEEVYTEILNLFKTYSQSPIFGVECTFEDVEQNIDSVTIPRAEDNLEIIETGYEHLASVSKANYAVGGSSTQTKANGEPDIIFSEEIGLAIERPPNGMTLE